MNQEFHGKSSIKFQLSRWLNVGASGIAIFIPRRTAELTFAMDLPSYKKTYNSALNFSFTYAMGQLPSLVVSSGDSFPTFCRTWPEVYSNTQVFHEDFQRLKREYFMIECDSHRKFEIRFLKPRPMTVHTYILLVAKFCKACLQTEKTHGHGFQYPWGRVQYGPI